MIHKWIIASYGYWLNIQKTKGNPLNIINSNVNSLRIIKSNPNPILFGYSQRKKIDRKSIEKNQSV